MTFKRHSRSSGMTRFDRAPMISYIRPISVSYSKYGPIFVSDSEIQGMKIVNFWYRNKIPHLYLALACLLG